MRFDFGKEGNGQNMKHIFFVEDDLSLIGGLTYALKKEGYEVENARTAAEAKSTVRKAPDSSMAEDWLVSM